MEKDRWTRLALASLLFAGIVLIFYYRDHFSFATLDHLVQKTDWWGPLAFILVYALATVLLLPGSILTLAGGALFGPLAGTFYNLTGATLGATLAFLVARYLAAGWVSRKAGARIQKILKGADEEGWRFVAFTRLVPLFPFFLLNYALGLTRIRLGHYMLATYIFMLPAAFALTYVGHAGREVAEGADNVAQKVLFALGLLAVIVFLPRFIKRLRKPLSTPPSPES